MKSELQRPEARDADEQQEESGDTVLEVGDGHFVSQIGEKGLRACGGFSRSTVQTEGMVRWSNALVQCQVCMQDDDDDNDNDDNDDNDSWAMDTSA